MTMVGPETEPSSEVFSLNDSELAKWAQLRNQLRRCLETVYDESASQGIVTTIEIDSRLELSVIPGCDLPLFQNGQEVKMNCQTGDLLRLKNISLRDAGKSRPQEELFLEGSLAHTDLTVRIPLDGLETHQIGASKPLSRQDGLPHYESGVKLKTGEAALLFTLY
jgi:hypothetical protein